MDRRRGQLRPLGLCKRLFDLFTKTIPALALKPLTLACPVFRSIAFCLRLFDFIMQTLAAQAVKPVMLGPPVLTPVSISSDSQNGCTSTTDQNMPPMAHPLPCEMVSPRAKDVNPEQVQAIEKISTSMTTSSSTCSDIEKDASYPNLGKRPEEVVPEPTLAPQARAPKKMVSINDRVEEIYPEKKKRRKTEKLPSMEREKDEQKPLKSILKVRSNVKDEGNNGA